MVDALIRAFTGFGWVLVPPVPPFEPGVAVPVPRPADPLRVPLSRRERAEFRRIVG
ncbi:hypothetical protein [Amycolatopsis sp. NBRC 101858]|uniref:hypothetical protein n=1 Tax=Amycolatopsis sp. NBRC 101858 TaxID=3032200 RepID=UPI002552E521|nr:hypothetical protein [Amycolatopsis sp. NBRC 101858]